MSGWSHVWPTAVRQLQSFNSPRNDLNEYLGAVATTTRRLGECFAPLPALQGGRRFDPSVIQIHRQDAEHRVAGINVVTTPGGRFSIFLCLAQLLMVQRVSVGGMPLALRVPLVVTWVTPYSQLQIKE